MLSLENWAPSKALVLTAYTSVLAQGLFSMQLKLYVYRICDWCYNLLLCIITIMFIITIIGVIVIIISYAIYLLCTIVLCACTAVCCMICYDIVIILYYYITQCYTISYYFTFNITLHCITLSYIIVCYITHTSYTAAILTRVSP